MDQVSQNLYRGACTAGNECRRMQGFIISMPKTDTLLTLHIPDLKLTCVLNEELHLCPGIPAACLI